jgi:hypothetical protein
MKTQKRKKHPRGCKKNEEFLRILKKSVDKCGGGEYDINAR